MLKLFSVYESLVQEEKQSGAMFHCSAGIGRSSTFVLGVLLRDLLKQTKRRLTLGDVARFMIQIRTRRPGAFNTPHIHGEFALKLALALQNQAGF